MTLRQRIHSIIYFLLLLLGLVSMPASNYTMNMAWVLMAANWLLEWDMHDKFAHLDRRYLLQAWLVLMAVHVVGLLWSHNMAYGLDDIRKKLPLLLVPLVVMTSKPLSGRQYRVLLWGYATSVFCVSLVGWYRYLTIDDLPYREIVPFISHIRYSLNVCMVVVLLGWQVVRARRAAWRWMSVALGCYFVLFLLLLQSYTGVVVLLAVSLMLLFREAGLMHSRVLRVAIPAVALSVVAVVVAMIAYHVAGYYRLIPSAKAPLAVTTVNGNRYHHLCDGLIENGNYVNNYLCEEELDEQWKRVTGHGTESLTATGYPVRGALIRYLNALGLTKDSAGVAQLSATDVEWIEKGVANPVYLRRISMKRMVYVMCFERENYRCYRTVKNFTMLQRFELWKTGWRVFENHWLIGVGTGDVVDCCHEQLAADGSDLAGTTKHTHNQYLTLLIAFGVVGFGVIVLAFARAWRRERIGQCAPLLSVWVISLISFLTEDTLETLAGCMFVVLLTSLFATYRLSPKIKEDKKNEEERLSDMEKTDKCRC